MIQDAIYQNGKVAIRYLQPIQKYIQLGNKHEYVFVPRYSVSLAWVDEEDVDTIINMQPSSRRCCGGSGRGSGFILASQSMLNCWIDGSR